MTLDGAEARDVRARILQEATRLFAEAGYDGTSVQAIADAVGIRKPSLLYWFPSKDALRRAVLDDMLSHWKQELPRVLAASTRGKDRFASGIHAVLDFFRADPARARLVVREMLDRPDEVRELLLQHFRPWTRMITDYIRMGQASGSVRSEVDAEAWVVQVVTMAIGTLAVGGVTSSLVARPDTEEPPTLAEQTDEVVRIARGSLFNVRYAAAPAEILLAADEDCDG